ncbi:helix-turn-helix domain-containing protein [Paenibacillus sp. WLX2291]|uniref:AraC-like ligand-binding domain-containing protein n=1 Tax=Paenibacillus sp. WLX2291 TaxID=3296934 RepID=UPI003983EFBC
MTTILSTEQVKEREQFAYWRETLCDVFVQLDADNLSVRPDFAGRLEIGQLEQLQITDVLSDPQHVIRSRQQIARANEEYFLLSLQVSGHGYTSQDKREANLEPGDFVLYDTTRPYVLHFEQPFQQIVFRLPRQLLLNRHTHAEQLTSLRMPGQHPVTMMVSSFLRTVSSTYHHFDPATRLRVSDSIVDLLSTALYLAEGADRPRIETDSLALAHRTAAHSYIAAHLNDHQLSPAAIAAHLGISLRYLHRLFEAEGQSVAACIRHQRLQQSARMLADRRQLHRTVMDIALSWGFNDAAHFSRLFRQQYGMSPSEYRLQSLSDTQNL